MRLPLILTVFLGFSISFSAGGDDAKTLDLQAIATQISADPKYDEAKLKNALFSIQKNRPNPFVLTPFLC
jgi:hypothetical protein